MKINWNIFCKRKKQNSGMWILWYLMNEMWRTKIIDIAGIREKKMVLFFNSENRDFILDQILMVSYLYVCLPLNRKLYKKW
jgi:hypothetical protein